MKWRESSCNIVFYFIEDVFFSKLRIKETDVSNNKRDNGGKKEVREGGRKRKRKRKKGWEGG